MTTVVRIGSLAERRAAVLAAEQVLAVPGALTA
ncbi:hypothetical protein SAMN06272739_2131 [Blastococcus haudaquaticus]|uniref:Uncharacterized protein n=1 Tax=Blastococcus haudaquaticus TaxID=1938745 RepID=A0A286GVH0_9ACTN|nr:hypothetical protein SAMN06272739_2131 [Blastococcus haudaquaticus]